MDAGGYNYHGALQVSSVPSPFPLRQGLYSNMQHMASLTARTTGLCCHCGRGLPYDKYYFWCLFCDLRFCADCPGSHPPTHQPYYKWLIDRATPRGALPTQKACMKCKRLSHCSLGCDDCELNFCVDCAASSRDSLANHGHGKMATIRAPDDFGVSSYNLDCDSCQAGATLSHCGRCGNGIKKRDSFWACVTCVKDYNGQIRFCEECQIPGRQDHDPTHKFASFQYRVDMNMDPKYNIVRCLDCKQTVSFNGQSLARHSHTRFQITMGEAEKDRRVYHSYRTCARKPVRDIATVSAEAHNLLCQCCNQRFSLNSNIFLCPSCTLMTCETCAEAGGARSHPHIMIPVSLNRAMPPDDLWKQLVTPSLSARACDKCEKPITPHGDCYIQCNHCTMWNICLDCTKKRNIPVRHTCSDPVEMTLFDPVDRGSNWLAMQVSMAQRAMTGQQQPLVLLPGQVGYNMPTGQPLPSPSGAGFNAPSPQPVMIQRQQSAIKRKPASIRTSSSSSISPIQPVPPPAQGINNPTPATPPPMAQIIVPQSTQMTAPYGFTPIELPVQQNVLSPIQPSIQPFTPPSDIKRKALSPKIENASRVVYDKTSSASRAVYDRASSMAKDIDTDAVKKMGKGFLKGTAKVAGAVGVAVLRNEVQQATGVQLPAGRLNNRPNQQQALAMNSQMQQQMQTINKLNAQLQLTQKIAQLQQAQTAAAAAQSGGVNLPSSNTPLQIQMNTSNTASPVPVSQNTVPVQHTLVSTPPIQGTVPVQVPGTVNSVPPGQPTIPLEDTMAPIPACELASLSESENSFAPIPPSEQPLPAFPLNSNVGYLQPADTQPNIHLPTAPENTTTGDSHVEVNLHVSSPQAEPSSPPPHNSMEAPADTQNIDSPESHSNHENEMNQGHVNDISQSGHQDSSYATQDTPAGAHPPTPDQPGPQFQSTQSQQSSIVDNHTNSQQQSHEININHQTYPGDLSQVHSQSTFTQHIDSNVYPSSPPPQAPNSIPQNAHSSPPPANVPQHAHSPPSTHQPSIEINLPANGAEADSYYQGHPLNHITGGPQGQTIPSFSANSSTAHATPQTSFSQMSIPPSYPPSPLPPASAISPPSPLPPASAIPAPGANLPPQITIQMPSGNRPDAATVAQQQQQQQQLQMANNQLNQQNQQLQQLQQKINMMNMQQQQQQQQNNPQSAAQQTIDNLQIGLLSNQLQQQEQQQQQQRIDTGLSIINSLTNTFGNNSNNNNTNSFLPNLYGNNNQLAGMEIANMQNEINAQMAAINNINQSNDFLAIQQLNNMATNDQTNLEIQQLNDQLAALNTSTVDVNSINNQVFTTDSFTENVDVNVDMNILDSFGGGMMGMDLSESVVVVSQDDTTFDF